MKRILFLTFYFRPDLCAGSFRNSPLLDELSQLTKDQNIRIDVYTTIPNRYASFKSSYQRIEEFDNVRIERIHVPPHKSKVKDQMMSFRSYYFETIRKTKNTPYDLVYTSSSRFFTSWLGYKIARSNNCPLYVDVRDIFSETIEELSGNPAFRTLIPPFISFLENRVYSYARHINLISEGFKDSFKKYSDTSFSFFSHGVDPMFINQSQSVKKTENRSDKPKKILYAGNVGDGQGLQKIIPDAAKQLDGTHEFEIIGDGGALDKLKSELSEKQVENVTLTKPVEREKLVEKYLDSNILFIHLNDLEIFKKVLPSKIFELAVIQKPILAGVSGYAKTFLQEHVPHSFIFEPGNVKELMEQIEKIDQAKIETDSDESKSFAETFNREKINEQMAVSIKKLLTES